MPRAFIYVVDRDFGFAPNPFHGYCTLATCKPRIRSAAKPLDWVIGMGGARLKFNNHCIFAMKVTDKISFNEYWESEIFSQKKPVRNGSARMLVGDNIYYFENNQWHQADSHHSMNDGSPNNANIKNDTRSNSVLISKEFFYFGKEAPEIPSNILSDLGYKNGRNHRNFDVIDICPLIKFLSSFPKNRVLSDPCDFQIAGMRYTGVGSGIK